MTRLDTPENPRTVEELGRQIDRGLLDLTLVGSPEELLSGNLEDPELRDRVRADGANLAVFVNMNLALPPFDDVHVRRAVTLTLDRKKLARLEDERRTDRGTTVPNWHIAPDGVEGGLLSDWQPSWSQRWTARGVSRRPEPRWPSPVTTVTATAAATPARAVPCRWWSVLVTRWSTRLRASSDGSGSGLTLR